MDYRFKQKNPKGIQHSPYGPPPAPMDYRFKQKISKGIQHSPYVPPPAPMDYECSQMNPEGIQHSPYVPTPAPMDYGFSQMNPAGLQQNPHVPPPAPMDYGFSQMNPAGLQQNPHVPPPAPSPILMMAPPAPAAPQQTVVMVGSNGLSPGVCTVCRVGKIRDTASCCTWFWCCMLLPFGLIPGIIAFCCCCRHPKCSHCGYTVD